MSQQEYRGGRIDNCTAALDRQSRLAAWRPVDRKDNKSWVESVP